MDRTPSRLSDSPRRRLAAIAVACGLGAFTACSDTAPSADSSADTVTAGPTEGAQPNQAQPNQTQTDDPQTLPPTPTDATGSPVRGEPREVITGLAVPWGIDFLPDGTAVVTERDTGEVLLLAAGSGGTRTTKVAGKVEAHSTSESGLLGVAVSPDFAQDHTVFFYVSTPEDNRVVRARLRADRIDEPEPVLTGIPVSSNHDGGRLAFGPDGYLYVATGDSLEPDLAQHPDSLAGKILRITPDGDPAPGNPWDSPVWSMGHRNVQGLAFDSEGQLWASEFGDSTWDELNKITKGGNYGWPYREGNELGPSMTTPPDGLIAPAAVWNPGEASPSGLAFHRGRFWLGGLRGTRLWSIPLRDDGTLGEPTPSLVNTYGRLRTVVVAPDGRLWVTTSNTDGRAEPKPGDDRILSLP